MVRSAPESRLDRAADGQMRGLRRSLIAVAYERTASDADEPSPTISR
jgi:hypothetical protein